MDRKRVFEEVVEILANKLHQLPPLSDGEDFDYENQKLVPDVTNNQLDIAEVSMDLEDAFGVNFDEILPGGDGMETIGLVVDFIQRKAGTPRSASAKD